MYDSSEGSLDYALQFTAQIAITSLVCAHKSIAFLKPHKHTNRYTDTLQDTMQNYCKARNINLAKLAFEVKRTQS